MAFDISTLAVAADTTHDVHLTHPVSGDLLWADEAETKPVAIRVYGKNSKAYRDATAVIQKRRFKNLKKEYTPEEMASDSVALLAACSVEALNLEYKGEKLDNPVAFKKLYSDNDLEWIKKLVDAAIEDTANFLK